MQSAPEPLSWLTLERYALGELSAEERRDVESHLAASELDRACLAEIMSDQSELPPLVPAAVPISSARARKKPSWLPWSLGMCAAAAALLLVLRKPADQHALDPTFEGEHVKGTDVTLRLHSDRRGADPHNFRTGERFKLEVTCPPGLSDKLRLIVVQGAEQFEPAPRDANFRCGNLVSWPGAFALDGSEPVEVCMYWGASSSPSHEELSRTAACTRLLPD